MLFNLDKCHIMHFGEKNLRHTYTINGHELTEVSEEKDLGVMISNTGTPCLQVATAASKGNQVLGQLLRSFTYKDKVTFVKLYKQYVRPHLENCIQAWCPWQIQDIELLENVQMRAVRAISGIHGSYEEKLKQIKLETLQARRMRGDMIETFKILHGFENVNPDKFFNKAGSQHLHRTRLTSVLSSETVETPSFGLVKKKHNLALRGNFFSQRSVIPWNNLPAEVRASKSI